jgi:putative glycosyltransferase
MKLSIVTTLYRSSLHVREFHARMSAAARACVGNDFEIIMVNDGSPDDSLDIAVALALENRHLRVVDLSRNFGHHKAIMTGLEYAKGDRIYLIDSDLEEEPEWLLAFAEQMEQARCDVVYGVQERRKGGIFERWSGRWFYRAFRALTGLDLPEDVVTARLMSRRYVKALTSHRERELFLAGLWYITGFDQRPRTVTKHSTSETTYTLSRRISLLVNSVTSFSNAPLIGIFNIGAVISMLAAAYFAYLLINWALLSHPLSGWTSVMASIWLLGGMIISFIGIVGIYLSKVYSETKQRPYAIVRQVYGGRDDGPAR